MNPSQLRKLIKDVLSIIGYWSQEAEDLLMLTAAQESHCGKYIRQIGGPACGIFQMEPATMKDLWANFLSFRPHLQKVVESFQTGMDPVLDLTGNLLFQIVIARVNYLRKKGPIPAMGKDKDGYIRALAEYWKEHWNTSLGAGTVEEAAQNYKRYVGEK